MIMNDSVQVITFFGILRASRPRILTGSNSLENFSAAIPRSQSATHKQFCGIHSLPIPVAELINLVHPTPEVHFIPHHRINS